MGLKLNYKALSNKYRRNNMVKSLNKAKAQRHSNKMLTININNRVNKTNRVKQVQKQKLQKSVQLVKQQFKKYLNNY